MEIPTYTVTVTADKAGTRLDRLLADALGDFSRSRLRALIKEGRVRDADGRAVSDPDRRVRAGDRFRVTAPPPTTTALAPLDLPLSIVHEDEHLIVVDKSAGLVVHPGAGHRERTLVNALLAHCPEGLAPAGGPLRPGVVHRLDKDTTGLLVAAKSDPAYHGLREQFAAHTVERAYYACVWGRPGVPEGRIAGRIARDPRNRLRMASAERGGKPAITNYRTIETFDAIASFIECRLETGRTHQIRVHMAVLGHPLLGDQTYQARRPRRVASGALPAAIARFPRQALHAHLLGFVHPISRQPMRFTAPLPLDFRTLLEELKSVRNLTNRTNPVSNQVAYSEGDADPCRPSFDDTEIR